MSKAKALGRIRLIERARVFRNLSKDTGLSYRDLQKRFKGISTEEITGKWVFRDRLPIREGGRIVGTRLVSGREGPSERVQGIFEGLGIISATGDALVRY